MEEETLETVQIASHTNAHNPIHSMLIRTNKEQRTGVSLWRQRHCSMAQSSSSGNGEMVFGQWCCAVCVRKNEEDRG